jgi:GNAT superfamily N-acetyltransferase
VTSGTASLRIRPFAEHDADPVLDIALRAWQPVMPSIEQDFGPELYRLLTPDWRAEKREEIAAFTGEAKSLDAFVAVVDDVPVGYVALRLDTKARLGEISLIAVDPDHQRAGVGSKLLQFALDTMKHAGMVAAMVETGFDPGHAPARGAYEKAGFVNIPAARYWKQL